MRACVCACVIARAQQKTNIAQKYGGAENINSNERKYARNYIWAGRQINERRCVAREYLLRIKHSFLFLFFLFCPPFEAEIKFTKTRLLINLPTAQHTGIITMETRIVSEVTKQIATKQFQQLQNKNKLDVNIADDNARLLLL